jgi:pimeloyl-ACP methyl ester carboxylesterase
MRNTAAVILAVLMAFTTFAACSCNNNNSAKFTSSPISLTTSSGTLYGTLVSPSNQTACPVILIIAGSGPTDRDGNNPLIAGKNNNLKMIAEALAQNGFASVRYDKRGIGESQSAGLNESDLRFDNYVDDAADWVAMLKNDSRFSEVGIIGHSEGSLIGMIAANKSDSAFFVSLEGAGRPAYDIIIEQLAGQPQAVISEVKRINAELIAGNTVADVDPGYYSLFRPSVQPYLISWYKYDPAVEIANLTCPVLIVQGTTDLQVSQKDADLLKAAKPDAAYALIEGMNHILKDAPLNKTENLAAYSNPDLPLTPDFVTELIAFVKDTTK